MVIIPGGSVNVTVRLSRQIFGTSLAAHSIQNPAYNADLGPVAVLRPGLRGVPGARQAAVGAPAEGRRRRARRVASRRA
jgi:hypothetical protein